MAHNFLRGINWVSDPTGATPLNNHRFISHSGDPGNDPTDPDTPFDTPDDINDSNTWIVGAGFYPTTNVAGAPNVYGDYGVRPVLDGASTESITIYRPDHLELSNFDTLTVTNMLDCFVHDCQNFTHIQDQSSEDNVFMNIPNMNTTREVNRNAYFNCHWASFAHTVNRRLSDSYFHSDCSIVITTAKALDGSIQNCIINCPVTVDATPYADIEAARTGEGDPNLFPGCTIDDVEFTGDPYKKQFTIAPTSPAYKTAVGNLNKGGFPIGVSQDKDTDEFGVSPDSNTNTEFSGDTLIVTAPALSGNRVTAEIDLGQAVRSPILYLSAFLDYLNAIPDYDNTLTNSNLLTCRVDWAGRNQVYQSSFKTFRWDYNMFYDSVNDKYPGEAGYSQAYESILEVRYIKLEFTIRDDYNEA